MDSRRDRGVQAPHDGGRKVLSDVRELGERIQYIPLVDRPHHAQLVGLDGGIPGLVDAQGGKLAKEAALREHCDFVLVVHVQLVTPDQTQTVGLGGGLFVNCLVRLLKDRDGPGDYDEHGVALVSLLHDDLACDVDADLSRCRQSLHERFGAPAEEGRVAEKLHEHVPVGGDTAGHGGELRKCVGGKIPGLEHLEQDPLTLLGEHLQATHQDALVQRPQQTRGLGDDGRRPALDQAEGEHLAEGLALGHVAEVANTPLGDLDGAAADQEEAIVVLVAFLDDGLRPEVHAVLEVVGHEAQEGLATLARGEDLDPTEGLGLALRLIRVVTDHHVGRQDDLVHRVHRP
mmetsp:Transcript_143279/g.457793  ORF Transcript_143279/g.457793 Transcript_143279/m.457793 type:complete len:345 (+) Transcript_143279:1329-2363(+)